MIKAAVIGNPIKHSRSPLIHNFWLEKFNVDGSYEPIKAENNKSVKPRNSKSIFNKINKE